MLTKHAVQCVLQHAQQVQRALAALQNLHRCETIVTVAVCYTLMMLFVLCTVPEQICSASTKHEHPLCVYTCCMYSASCMDLQGNQGCMQQQATACFTLPILQYIRGLAAHSAQHSCAGSFSGSPAFRPHLLHLGHGPLVGLPHLLPQLGGFGLGSCLCLCSFLLLCLPPLLQCTRLCFSTLVSASKSHLCSSRQLVPLSLGTLLWQLLLPPRKATSSP